MILAEVVVVIFGSTSTVLTTTFLLEAVGLPEMLTMIVTVGSSEWCVAVAPWSFIFELYLLLVKLIVDKLLCILTQFRERNFFLFQLKCW